MQLLTLPGVFTPISDSWQLGDALRAEALAPGARVLDVCTGSGVLALTAASEGASVTAVDVSRRAVLTVRLNAWRQGVRVRARRGRTFAPVTGERFEVIVSNPPYVPSDDVELPTRGPQRAWEGGPDGRAVLDEICDGALAHLVPGGRLLLVHSALIGDDETLARLERAGFARAEVVARHRGRLGPLMQAQREAGRLPAGTEEEDVVVIRGVAPA